MNISVILLIFSCCFYIVSSGSVQSQIVKTAPKPVENHISTKSHLKSLESLDYRGLLTAAKSGKVLAFLARDVFQRKFAKRPIAFLAPFYTEDPQDLVIEMPENLLIHDYDVATSTLELFGNQIHELGIKYDRMNLVKRQQIHDLLSGHQYMLETLHLYDFDGDVLHHFKQPMFSVKHLTISGHLKVFQEFDLPLKLNEIFPRLRHLTLHNVWLAQPHLLAAEFPQLEQVQIRFIPASHGPLNLVKTKAALTLLFEHNPQITNLTLENCNSLNFAKIASDLLPNLNEVYLDFGKLSENYTDDIIEFGKVKILRMNWHSYDLAQHFEFGQVEDLFLNGLSSECAIIATQNPNVQNFKLVVGDLDDEDILDMVDHMPNLINWNICSKIEIDHTTIIEVVEKSKLLKTLTLDIWNKDLYNNLKRHFEKQQSWSVSVNGNIFYIEKH